MRDAVQEVRGAVEWIDDPPVTLIGAGARAAFLDEKAVIRPRLGEFRADDFLSAAIGGGDEIARSFQRDLQVLDLAEIAFEALTGAVRRFRHNVKDCGMGHGGLRYGAS